MSSININQVKNPDYQRILRQADSNPDSERPFNGMIDDSTEIQKAYQVIVQGSETDTQKMLQALRMAVGLTESNQAKSMFDNKEFKLYQGHLHAWHGAKIEFDPDNSGREDLVKITFGSGDSGVVHEYDGGSWNGNPISLEQYSKLILEVISGDPSNMKLELSNNDVATFGTLKLGENITNLDKFRIKNPTITKIQFVGRAPGEVILKLSIK